MDSYEMPLGMRMMEPEVRVFDGVEVRISRKTGRFGTQRISITVNMGDWDLPVLDAPDMDAVDEQIEGIVHAMKQAREFVSRWSGPSSLHLPCSGERMAI